MQNNYVKID